MSDKFDNQFKVESNKTSINNVSIDKNFKKKKEDYLQGITILDKPSRKLPSLIEELLEKDIPVRLTKKGYLIGGFYGLGNNENKGFVFSQETDKENILVFFDNKGREHIIQSFEDLVKFNNFIWGIFFKISEDYKKPDLLWFQYMLQFNVLNITPGNIK
jgi:hypothetical protein